MVIAMVSCGGPYRAKRTNQPGEKLAVADALFNRGKYGDAAVEYKDFLQTFAGDDRCDYAQFRLAESYRMDKEYALAAVEYRILQTDYGYSEYVDDAFFLEAVCAFKQSPRAERDQAKSYEALDRVNRFLQVFPTSPRADEARALRLEIHEKLGHKEFLNARLYFRKKRYAAALVYFNKIIDLYPATTWAARSHYYRGYIKEARGDMTGAAADYRVAAGAGEASDERAEAGKRLKLIEGSIGQSKGS
jgi:outer membrane protein assembly factor BamD